MEIEWLYFHNGVCEGIFVPERKTSWGYSSETFIYEILKNIGGYEKGQVISSINERGRAGFDNERSWSVRKATESEVREWKLKAIMAIL